MTGFVHSKINNVQILIFNSTVDTIGIALTHGIGAQDYCYFNEINSCRITLTNPDNLQRGTGILIGGSVSSGANVNKINQGAISGLELNGIVIDNNSVGNLILNTDFEAYGIPTPKLNTAIRINVGNSNTIIAAHVENYQRSIICGGNGNYIQGLNIAAIDLDNTDTGSGNMWVLEKQISNGGKPVQYTRSAIQTSDDIFPSFIINSKNASLDARNYAITGGFAGTELEIRRSLLKDGDPIAASELLGLFNFQKHFEFKNNIRGEFIPNYNANSNALADGWTNGYFFSNNYDGVVRKVQTTIFPQNEVAHMFDIVFKEYSATLLQTTTGNPVATIIDNKLSGAVTWVRNSVGEYDGTLTGAFLSGTVALNISPTLGFIEIIRQDDDTIRIKTYSVLGVLADDILKGNTVSIRVKI